MYGRWEVDFFHNLGGEMENLVMAELELTSEDEGIEIPNWVKQEVSTDKRYSNTYLARNFSTKSTQ
jgi:adenylate cyclase